MKYAPLFLCAVSLFIPSSTLQGKQATDYNGTPLTHSNSITLTPQTSSALLASYTQPVSFAGFLDNTFGSLGLVTTDVITPHNSQISAALLQQDSKIVAVGYVNNGAQFIFSLIRYNPNGSLDTSFGPNHTGIVTTSMAAASQANAALLQPDGKIIALGESAIAGPLSFCLLRYNSNGSIDTTFNGGEPTTTPATTIAYAGLLQPDGKIIALGDDGAHFCLVRYNADGSIDNSFNGGVPISTNNTNSAKAGLLQPDGKIIALGRNDLDHFCLVRYNSNGAIDNSFNNGIPVSTNNTQVAIAALLQPNGKIVAVGGDGTHFCLVRYNSDGSIDTTFNNGIPVSTSNTALAYAALLQPDGKIIALGNNAGTFCLVRYNSNGSIDTTFNNGIPVSTPGTESVYAALLQPDNKIIGLGIRGIVCCVARYINPFTLSSFEASYGTVGLL